MLKELLDLIPQTGRLEWIGIRPGKKQALTALKSVRMEQGSGLEGDRFRGSVSGKRQVTLIQQEHLQVVANILGKSEIDPGWTRRNLVVSGISLLDLKHQSFQIGVAVLQTTGIFAPASGWKKTSDPWARTRCAAMEESLRKSSNPVKSRSVTRCGSFKLESTNPGDIDDNRSFCFSRRQSILRREVGLAEGVVFHTLRHIFATRMEMLVCL